MLNNIIIYNYDSEVKKISPFIKILSFIIYMIQILVFQDITSQIILYLELIFIIYLSHIPFQIIFKKALLYTPILLFIILSPIKYLLIIKIFIMFIFLTIIDLTTNIKEMISGFEKILTPFKLLINTKKIALKITTILKYQTLLFNNIDIIKKEIRANSIRNKLIILILKMSIEKTNKEIKNIQTSNKINVYLKNNNSKKIYISDIDSYLIIIHIIVTLLLIMKGKI